MRKEIYKTIDIPEGVEVSIDGGLVKAKGPEGENSREFNINKLSLDKKENQIIVGSDKSTKKEKRRIHSIAAHIRNLIKGVTEKFEYKLKIASSHFPMTVEIQGNEIIIKNFLGEKIPRKSTIPQGAEVEINGDIITVKSTNKEFAGQTAANLEKTTWVRMKDRRIFQDGIFIISKDGKEI